MALILNIDTATEYASVCLADNGAVIEMRSNAQQKDHASFIQPAIKSITEATGIPLKNVDAIAVSNGPGSYTGLRVGLSTAKGICYALDKPLILINTLEVMATAIIEASLNTNMIDQQLPVLYCPMIDARRMEVFTAAYDQALQEMIAPSAMILNETSFEEVLMKHTIIFSGSGAKKFSNICNNNNAYFIDAQHDCSHMTRISEKMNLLKSFADKAYSEPLYLKDFFTSQQKIKSN